MAATTSASSSNLGKKPTKWFFMDEEILHLPSRKMGMDAGSELRCRREAAEFIFEMSERLNHNLPHNRGQINHNCMCIAMVHMHRFYVVHPFTVFPPKDVAAACLFMAGKSEECPRKLEHIVEVWFKLKHRKAEVQPPFNDTVRKNGADLIVFLEQILLQTIGFDLHVALPHPIVIFNMDKFKLDNKKLTRCAYWFATDIIQLTNWCIRYNERTMACICISIACSWADYEIPETAGTPWYKDIDPEMTEELLNKLVEEFTRVYEEFAACSHARRFIEKAKNANPSTMPAKSIAQLPPPPPPPVLQQQQIVPKKEPVVDEQPPPTQKPPMQRPATADGTLERVRKRSPAQEMPSIDQPGPAAKKFIASNKSATNSRVATPDIKNSPTVPPPSQPQITGDQLKIPQIKQEVADSSPASISPDKKPNEDGSAAQKKKIGLSEYKQRMKHIKQETPSDSPASQSTPTSMHGTTPNMSNVKIEDGNGSAGNGNCTATTPSSSMAQTAVDGEQKVKRQSFMPDLSNASSSISVIGAEALTLPVGIPLVEDKKKKERAQQPKSNPPKNLDQSKEQQRMNKEGSSNRNAGHNIQTSNSATNHRSHSQQHHQQHHKERSHPQQQHGQHREKTDKHQHRSNSGSNHNHREGSSTKIYLNGVSSSGGATSAQRHHKPENRGEKRPKIVYQVKEVKQEKQLGMMNFVGKQPPLPPSSPNGNGNAAPPPPPPPPENELEEGELV